MAALFLDTNVLVFATTGRERNAANLVFSSDYELVTNEYAIKEMRRILLHTVNMSQEDIGLAVDRIRQYCRVLPSPNVEACRKIIIDDHSDRPIVAGAIEAHATLLTFDHKLRVQAKMYVETATP
ncbi:MAG: PIN domain-containing protein [Candidatus Micrarchaeia archaeon]|jgi:predicted nucleic acid-binding protein